MMNNKIKPIAILTLITFIMTLLITIVYNYAR
jgi:hypothetical protein